MNSLLAAALELQEFCLANQWRFCFIGGLAVQRWGVPRNTGDVDATLLTGELYPGVSLFTCEASGLMVLKLLAHRGRDIDDAEGIAVRNRETLDWSYIEQNLTWLAEAKEEPEILDTLARLRRDYS